MPFSISSDTAFKDINWNNLENRPSIDDSMIFCKDSDWHKSAKCCMDGYTIEHVLDISHEQSSHSSPAAKFLEEYPCLNGLELDRIVEELSNAPKIICEKVNAALKNAVDFSRNRL